MELDPQSMTDIEMALEVARAQLAPDAIVVKSDLWPRANGRVDWELRAGDYTTAGQSSSVDAAFEVMDSVVREWFPELAADPAFKIVRLLRDG